jgi:hypothetical protein
MQRLLRLLISETPDAGGGVVVVPPPPVNGESVTPAERGSPSLTIEAKSDTSSNGAAVADRVAGPLGGAGRVDDGHRVRDREHVDLRAVRPEPGVVKVQAWLT